MKVETMKSPVALKVKCPISGLSYEVFLPYGTSTGGVVSAPHPVLLMSASDLSKYYLEDWAAGTLAPEVTHLLGLSYLLKLPVVEVPSLPSTSFHTMQDFWSKNMQSLAAVATRLDGKAAPKKTPRIRVTIDNLSNLRHWLEDLSQTISYSSMSIDSDRVRKLNAAQFKAEELAKNDSTRNIAMYDSDEINELIIRGLKGSRLNKKEGKAFPSLIADWTHASAPFPMARVTLPSGKKVTVCDHWKRIICFAFSDSGLLDLLADSDTNLGDIDELLEHCYAEVEVGTIHASALFERLAQLRAAAEDYKLNPPQPTVKQAIKKAKAMKDEDLFLLLTSDDEPSHLDDLLTHTHAPAAKLPDSSLTLSQRLALKLKKQA